MGNHYAFNGISVHQQKKKGVSIGKLVMEKLIEQVKDKSYASIGLFAWDANPRNIPFYAHFGFEITSGMELKKYMTPE